MTILPNPLVDIRCPYCNRLLFRYRVATHGEVAHLLQEDLNEVEIEIKCERCKSIVEPRIAPEYRRDPIVT